MPGAWTISDCVAPVPGDSPAGSDACDLNDWPFLIEARREEAPDPARSDRKVADWPRAEDLATEILAQKSKDLRVAVYLLEAKLQRHGFAGLRDGLFVLRSVADAFWDSGLHPSIEDGEPGNRIRPLEWLNARLPALLIRVPVTRRVSGENYAYEKYLESRQVGFEKDIRTADGDGGYARRLQREAALKRGEISGEMFEAAVKASSRRNAEQLATEFSEAFAEFSQLEQMLARRLEGADAVPDLGSARQTLKSIQQLLEQIARQKRAEEPDPVPVAKPAAAGTAPARPVTFSGPGESNASTPDGWGHAEQLIRGGQIEPGLAEMTRLAAAEHGRARFQRRLTLAEVCLQLKRDRLATAILEELNEQIRNFHLDQWESPELIARVWGNLYRQYRGEESSHEKAGQLYQQLCRLDPWQALRWEE